MTPKEHSLMIFMLARQAMLFKTLAEALKSRGVLDADDFPAFDSVVRQEEAMSAGVSQAVAKQYQEFARALGLETGIKGV